MKKILLTTLFAAAAHLAPTVCAAAEYTLPRLLDGVMPNTEVSTNLPLHVKAEKLREFALTLNAASCASNEVLVAIGCDADGNGDLSFDETAFVFGCDCGERYLVDYVSGTVDDTVGETVVVGWRSFDPAWNMAKVVKRGAGTVGETIVETVLNKRFDITIR
jgi:hypothetical protein